MSRPVPTSSAPAFLLFSLNWIIFRSQPMGVMQLVKGVGGGQPGASEGRRFRCGAPVQQPQLTMHGCVSSAWLKTQGAGH